MSEPKFSPEPWKAVSDQRWEAINIVDGNGQLLALVKGEAIAALIAVAAELYQDLHEAACEMCIPCWEANGMNTDSDEFGKSCPFPKSECFVKQWLETLKKARGEA